MTMFSTRLLRMGLQRYLGHLKRHPWRTQALTTGALMGGGDVVAQVCISRRSFRDYDLGRTCRFFGCGLFVFGPSMHVWYSGLDKFIRGPFRIAAFKKFLLDQGLFLPLYLVSFLVLMAALRGESQPEIWSQLQRDFQPMLFACYSVWPPVQAISFTFVPGPFRVLLINVVSLFWNAYLSCMETSTQ